MTTESETRAGERTAVRRLDESTVARIAAGEVVTRPAAAVRELVENALDAGASAVSVTVENGGLDLVSVSDDGHGMSREDARLAVERHATSKIRDAADLATAPTLGFRGEALPSIAEVARLDLRTRTAGEDEGTRVTVADGDPTVRAAGHGVGTTVEARDLFADLPARRESLGTPKREFARVSDLLASYALAHPDVRFRLDHDGRTVLSTPGSGEETDTLLAVYGRDVAGRSTALAAGDDDEVAVHGVCVHPSVTRASASHVTVAVNGRPLADSGLRNAVEAGYGSLLPGDRHPVAVVRVRVPPDRVDQNVHPGKREVRFRDAEAVHGAVERAVRDALSTADLARSGEAELGIDLDGEGGLEPTRSRFEDLTVIGQFRGLYLLCEAGDDLLVVDQHAAHERVNYERLREAVAGAEVETLSVDPPATLSLSPGAAATLDARREAVESLGFRVESFGGGTYRVTGVPAPFGRAAAPEDVRDLLDTFLSGESPEDPREALLAEMACHPSLKAGDDLTDEESAALLDRLGACRQPYACPHGRPTVLSIEETTLAKGFGRSGTRFD
ncbi:DNA mismatch repair endonuclease MutL [Halomarina litorea]|uniref:DNA mismatch repair endonuclease MutL n=1 Tax=Halomarina litorea TaxID=2961595 RepID=UPI0020C39802|nr:DNA mismatch repair endonuclease MutL [Halomarina sp. BCD28]